MTGEITTISSGKTSATASRRAAARRLTSMRDEDSSTIGSSDQAAIVHGAAISISATNAAPIGISKGIQKAMAAQRRLGSRGSRISRHAPSAVLLKYNVTATGSAA